MHTEFHYPFICWCTFIWPYREMMETSGDGAYLVAAIGCSAPSLSL